jgi:hypothetical protein
MRIFTARGFGTGCGRGGDDDGAANGRQSWSPSDLHGKVTDAFS